MNLLNADAVIDTAAYKLPNAYPVLEHGIEKIVKPVFEFWQRFSNFQLLGRSATFAYLHLHDLFREGRCVIEKLTDQ